MHDIRTLLKIIITAAAMLTAASRGLCQISVPQHFQVRPLYRHDTLTIVAVGDIMMHEMQIQKALQKDGSYDFSSCFKLVRDRIEGADIAIGNMEFTLAGEPYTGYPCFSAPDSFAEHVADCGFDVFLCANNHIFDKGMAGAERTLGIYRGMMQDRGTRFTGLAGSEEELEENNPLMLVCKGIRVALVNFTYGTNSGGWAGYPKVNRLSDKDLLKETLKRAEKADMTIVMPHWGEEYVLTHSARQRSEAEWMAGNGADIILGSHPHVVQDREVIDGVHVAYSLGNMVSNMSAANTQLELMATIRIVRYGNGDIRMLEPEFTWLWCSRPGGFCEGYCVVPVEEYIGTRDQWVGPWEYDKMMATFHRVLSHSGPNQDYDK
ncbi:MAG: CapA family protein [Candidatus Cryptobacteroides sp.]